ncbi:hypothetical protein [Clostridium beijerinckii]|uniref:hypothetical protein n=1 Tax=Clostridium beijerinckii TaxID=1520 RepID=UPI00098C230F|nr:hypothetical protein [Clostridium beijerinckii]NRT76264.1 hypothetical protein [Clostridium beijerinckii]OOM37164.1 hypothetical protein CBEIJ_50120 [Clostridium beijerinckii]
MKLVMNHDQYLEWKYGSKTTLDIKLENLGIRNSKEFERQFVIGIAVAFFIANHPTIVHAVNSDGIDDLGATFLSYIRKGGRWIAIICASVEIIRSGMKKGGSASEIGQIVIKYSLLYASLYIITWIFDQIEKVF